ncbi:hypothetical protein BRC94_10945 [Halobacteriales archaeon QS_5_70_17]|nr:MAG: hypothetical protein BRC94_10945 [Halobacteriales archaeon QS_5_70_17]
MGVHVFLFGKPTLASVQSLELVMAIRLQFLLHHDPVLVRDGERFFRWTWAASASGLPRGVSL